MTIGFDQDDITRQVPAQDNSSDSDFEDDVVRRIDDFDDDDDTGSTVTPAAMSPFAPLQNRLAAKAASIAQESASEPTASKSEVSPSSNQVSAGLARPAEGGGGLSGLVDSADDVVQQSAPEPTASKSEVSPSSNQVSTGLARPVEGGGGLSGLVDSADGVVTDKATIGQKALAGGSLGLNAFNGAEDLVGYAEAIPGGLEAVAPYASEIGAKVVGTELTHGAAQMKDWGDGITSFLGEGTAGALGEVADVVNPLSAGVKVVQSAGFVKDAIRQLGDRKRAADLTDPAKQKRLANAEEKAQSRRDELKEMQNKLQADKSSVSMKERNRIRMRAAVGITGLGLERRKQGLASNYQKTMDETAMALNAKIDSDANNEASFKAATAQYNAKNKGSELQPFARPVVTGLGKGANIFKKGAAAVSEGLASIFGVSSAESELYKGNAKTAAMSGGLATVGNTAKALTGGVTSLPGYGVNFVGKTLLGGASNLLGADKAQQQETYDEIWGDEYQDNLTKFGLQARPQAEAVDVAIKPDMKWAGSSQTLRGTDRAGIPNSTWSTVKDGVYGATAKPIADAAKLVSRNWKSPTDIGLRGTTAGIRSKIRDEQANIRAKAFEELPGTDAGMGADEVATSKGERRAASQAGYTPALPGGGMSPEEMAQWTTERAANSSAGYRPRSPVRDASYLFDDDEAPTPSVAPESDSESFEFPEAGLSEGEAMAAKAERRAASQAGYTPAPRATGNRMGTALNQTPDFQDEPNELERAIAATEGGDQAPAAPSARMAVEPGRGLLPFTSSPFIPRANPTPAAPKRRGGFLGRISNFFGRLFGRKNR